MNWFFAGWVLVLQALFWGVGLTWLILPPRWRRFWPAFCAPVGLGLQSAVVWAAAHTPLPGTDAYAHGSMLLPVGLLAAAYRRLGTASVANLLAAIRGWWVLALIMSISLGLQIAPLTKPPGRLTVLTMGSCDAADYAAGARVLKEFSSRDRSGFLGQPEQMRGLSVDNFYDFWLQINHFTPSALIALDATLLRRQPYELASLLGMVLLLVNLPLVFWLARSQFRFRPASAAAVTLIYGCSPLLFYAVYQVALGQLIAAPAVAMIFWTCLQADHAARLGHSHPRLWRFSGLLLTGNWLLFGGYNFFVLFAYIPVVAFVGGRVLWRRNGWAAAGRLGAFVGVNLLLCALLFPERVISLAERFLLFDKTPFGWKIAAFRPDGWYGSFGDIYLRPGPGWSLVLGLGCLLAFCAAAGWAVRRGWGRTIGLVAACTLPIFCGYGILTWEEAAGIRVNASYDAYKMFTVFYPTLLIPLCLWVAVGLRRSAPTLVRAGTAGLAALLVLVDAAGAWRYNGVLRHTGSMVDPGLSELSALERRPEIDGINIRLNTVWDRLWASQFLLHKKQYFVLPTYEGRAVTASQGRWDLCDGYTTVATPGAGEFLARSTEFVLVDRACAEGIEPLLLNGWYEPEQFRGSHWCWGGASPTISVTNGLNRALDGELQLAARSLSNRHLQLFAGPTLVWQGVSGGEVQSYSKVPIHLLPGRTLFRFETTEGLDRMQGDFRQSSFALYGFRIELPPPASATTASAGAAWPDTARPSVARP